MENHLGGTWSPRLGGTWGPKDRKQQNTIGVNRLRMGGTWAVAIAMAASALAGVPSGDGHDAPVMLEATWDDASALIAQTDVVDTYAEAVGVEIETTATLDASADRLATSTASLEEAALADATVEQTVTATYDYSYGTVVTAVETTVVLQPEDEQLLAAIADADAAVAEAQAVLAEPGLATDAELDAANAQVDAAVAQVDAELDAALATADAAQAAALEAAAEAVDEAVANLTEVAEESNEIVTELDGWASNLRYAVDRRGPKRRLTGDGVDIALIDSGIAPVPGLDAPGKIVNGLDLSGEGSFVDGMGHGTHLAGLIAGNDGAPVPGVPNFRGIAPDARLVNVRVANELGETSIDQLIAGIEWTILNRNANGMNIRVMVLAVGYDATDYMTDPLSAAIERAWANGIVVVVAGGNDGNTSNGLDAPAIDPYVISVAAASTAEPLDWSDDSVAAFSNGGNGVRNPDITAPGTSLVSLRVPGSWADRTYPQSAIGERFAVASGTSQAAAVTAGAVALLLEKDPTLTPDQVKRLLRDSGRTISAGENLDGKGTLRLNKALNRLRRGLEGSPVQQSHPISNAPEGFGTEVGGWSGGSWSGGSWSGGSWSGASWSGGSWSGGSWSGGSWSGGSWSGGSWSGGSWSGGSWSGGSWSSEIWN